MARKGLVEGLPTNIPDLEGPCTICLLTKSTKTHRGQIIDVSKFAPGFMLHMDFSFFNVEIICGFTSNVLAICYATPYSFGFPSIIKRTTIDILKFLVTTLSNQDKKSALI